LPERQIQLRRRGEGFGSTRTGARFLVADWYRDKSCSWLYDITEQTVNLLSNKPYFNTGDACDLWPDSFCRQHSRSRYLPKRQASPITQ
jgi:hypothetical protein